jgi:cytochrome P450/NADPH-cytochrome P450 reductase
MAILLQNFNFQLDDPSYQLKLKQSLTIKPKGFEMRAFLRDGIDATNLEKKLQAGFTPVATEGAATKDAGKRATNLKPMSIYYGSNTGTCEALASRLAKDAAAHGFEAKVDILDAATDKLPKDHPVAIITASYEGQPPDNAGHFVEWLKSLKAKELKGVQFAVYGCGHRDWHATFQKVPKLVDTLLKERGGERIVDRGLTDAAHGDMFTDFDTWEDTQYWPAIEKSYGGTATSPDSAFEPSIEVLISSQSRSTNLKQDVKNATLIENRLLTALGEPEKRHVEIKLPTDMVYKAGDYLAILPINPKKNIKRVVERFGLAWDAILNIKAKGPTVLPTDVNITAVDILSSYVELAQPATKKDVLALANAAADEGTRTALETLASDAFNTEVSQKRLSLLDLLELHPSINLAFSEFLSLLPPMRVRQYSISSSPLCTPETCTLTFGVLDQEAISGQGRYVGVASNYLARLEPGDHIQVSVRPSACSFSLPLDPVGTPIIMISTGSGLAPFRGFVQERAAQVGAGRKLAKALLFVGCRGKGDTLYEEELAKWAAMGAVDVRYAFSREKERSKGCKYVQDRLWNDRAEVVELFDQGGKVFVCGSRDVGEAVQLACKKMYLQEAEKLGKVKTKEQVEEWFLKLRNERYATDVFG